MTYQMHRSNAECKPQYVQHLWYKFMVHLGTEDFFAANYGVVKKSLKNWHNEKYNPDIINKLVQTYTPRMPSNGRIFL